MESNPTNVTLYMTRESRRFSYQQVLFFSFRYIPPFSEDFKAEMMCKWEGITVHVFEYYVHTHDHGILVEGYVVRNNTAIFLVKQSPKEKHHAMGSKIEVIEEITHHISFAFCEAYETDQTLWDCKKHHGDICSGRSIALAGWDGYSGHHKNTIFPDDVCIQFGKDFKLNYFVIQMHLEDSVLDPNSLKSNPANLTLFLTEKSRKYSYQSVNLFANGYIPAFSEEFKAEVTCKWEGVQINTYEYFAHTHGYGYLLEGYIIRNNTIIFARKEKTQNKTQDMIPIKGGPVEIRPGNLLAIGCSYRNPWPNNVTFGLKKGDEMCNLIYNFKYDAKEIDAFPRSVKCSSNVQDRVWCPKDASDSIDVLCVLQQAASIDVSSGISMYS